MDNELNKIFIIDSDNEQLGKLDEFAGNTGYQVESAGTGEAGFVGIKESPPDLILMDIQLSDMTGIQLMQEIKKIPELCQIPIILMSADSSEEAMVIGLSSGASDFIAKPIQLAELTVKTQNQIELVRYKRKLEESNIELEKEKHRLIKYAYYDSLTGLANRSLLLDRLHLELVHAKREKTMLALLFLDLDGFKEINDSLGHSTGDWLLRQVADRLKSCLRESDTISRKEIIARQGGDEFIILLTRLSTRAAAGKVAEKVIESVRYPFRYNFQDLSITVSIGIATYPETGSDADELLKNADAAMYEAKRRGKNRYICYGCD